MQRIKIGIGVSSIGRFLPLLAERSGLFQRHNVVAEIVNQQDEEKVVADLVSGEAPIGTPNTPSMLFSLLEGNDLVIVGGVINRPAFFLAARPEITALADLKGKKIGINQPRRMAGIVMLALLRRWGFDVERDLTLVDLGLNDRSVEALRAGQIDAALLPPEKAFLAEAGGFKILADSFALRCQWVPLATRRAFLAANTGLVKTTVQVYRDSIRFFNDRPEETLKQIADWLPGLAARPLALERCYRLFADCFEPTLAPSLPAVRSMLEEVALQDRRAETIDAASIVMDLSDQ